jgi:TonB family protein
LTSQPPAGGGRAEEPQKETPKERPKPKPPEPRRQVTPVPVPETADDEGASETAEKLPADADPDTAAELGVSVVLPGGGEGEVVIGVNGPISAYSYYLGVVRDKIARYWIPPAGLIAEGREVASIVNFRIDRRGKITGSYVEEPSGTSVFDQAGLRAVAQADPLPPLPQDYEGDWLGIHLRFVYRD